MQVSELGFFHAAMTNTLVLQNYQSHKNTGFLCGYTWSGQAVGFIYLSQHNLSISRVFPNTKAPEYLFQTKLIWFVIYEHMAS